MDTIEDLFRRFERLNEIGAALSHERDIDKLLESILVAAKTITHADGGTLYRMTEDERSLRFEIMHNDSLKIALGGTSGNPIPFPPLPLRTESGEENNSMVAAYAAIHQKTVNIDDAYEAEGFDFSGTRKFDARTGYRSQSFLTVPMKNHENAVIGVLQLINSIDPDNGKVAPFSAADQRLAESLASQAAIALTNRQLIDQLEKLFESFIQLINVAIDEKSPYTGGHCERVPVLTMMLAEAVNETQEGPLAGFGMTDKDRYELKIAGLLHDCGKVTTPVHVVDKATKLQTLFDRIHLVDTRFEVLKRDAEIAVLKARLALREARDTQADAALDENLSAQLQRLDADREFLRQANIGGELMTPEDQARVSRIGTGYRWIDVDGKPANFLSDDELENLNIRAGTLTQKERETINYHIVATIKMLEQLPWPKHLKNVPEYAGGHHERMDGKGYPKGLTREQMSVQARVMGIADIFEALTARDRPYKPGKTLSESLKILGNFRLNGHIDPDLFDVFVRQKVYLKYAARFLDPEQIDEVDESCIPGFSVGRKATVAPHQK
ncbi:MAG: GAF domain-containing protein [Burkholderiales bacterium]|nr:GAF domain-containing protein [Burkholderiales bacterium]